MATVWQAHQINPDREVAVKILNDDISDSPRDVENFYSEAKFAGALDHPNIVTVFEVGCQGGHYYCVMELAAGYDTGRWLERKGTLRESDVLTVAESVAVALDYAERKIGIIHCDIKPSNIMVDSDGTVRITDMGIAHVGKAVASSEYISGTPGFMSPEQTRGDEGLDSRADIYSLGATIYNLLCGKPLFHGRKDEEIIEAQCTDCMPDIRRTNPKVSAPCAVLISRFLAKDREDRPSGWPEALSLIRAVLAAGEAAERGDEQSVPEVLCCFSKPSTMALDGEEGQAPRPVEVEPAEVEEMLRHGRRFRDVFWPMVAAIAFLAFAVAFAIGRFL